VCARIRARECACCSWQYLHDWRSVVWCTGTLVLSDVCLLTPTQTKTGNHRVTCFLNRVGRLGQEHSCSTYRVLTALSRGMFVHTPRTLPNPATVVERVYKGVHCAAYSGKQQTYCSLCLRLRYECWLASCMNIRVHFRAFPTPH
jgi:hypothetical protein